MAFYDEMKENNIHVLAIPPHTNHLVQALDSTPFAQFKHCWQRNLLDWLFHNKGVTLSKKYFFEVFWPSFQESMTVTKIQSGFRKTGVFPINFKAIDKAKFAPAQVTDSKENSWMFIELNSNLNSNCCPQLICLSYTKHTTHCHVRNIHRGTKYNL